MRVSVVIPCYNSGSVLPVTLSSILPQLGDGDEIVIVDDGSTDDTKQVISSWLCDRVRYVWQPNSGGPASPRNHGIGIASGDVISLFDADDVMVEGKLEALKDAYRLHQDAGLLFTNFSTIDDAGQEITSRFLDSYQLTGRFRGAQQSLIRLDPPEAYRALGRENYIGTSGVAIPRKVFENVGGFDASLSNGDDRDMWFRVLRHYPAIYLPAVYHFYRIGDSSISKGKARDRAPSRIQVLERQLSDPIDEEFSRDAKRLIADNYHALAYEAFREGDMVRCRAYIKRGRTYSRTERWRSLWLRSLLGKKGSFLLRNLRDRVRAVFPARNSR